MLDFGLLGAAAAALANNGIVAAAFVRLAAALVLLVGLRGQRLSLGLDLGAVDQLMCTRYSFKFHFFYEERSTTSVKKNPAEQDPERRQIRKKHSRVLVV